MGDGATRRTVRSRSAFEQLSLEVRRLLSVAAGPQLVDGLVGQDAQSPSLLAELSDLGPRGTGAGSAPFPQQIPPRLFLLIDALADLA
jgi:hypothetical protein